MNKFTIFKRQHSERTSDHDAPVPAVGLDDDHLSILLVESDDEDAELVHELIRIKEKSFWNLTHVRTMSDAMESLKAERPDLAILNLFLPDATGMATLQKFVAQNPTLPIIVMTELKDEAIGKDAIREGAQDYLVKGQFTSDFFIRAVQYAIERKKLDSLRDELTSYMNHEVSNPLSMIKDSLAQLSDGILGPVNERQQQFLKMSLAGIDRLIKITEDVLLCTKLELGKLPVRKESISLSETAKEIVETFRPAFDQKGVELKLRLPLRNARINADKERIGQIITNLLSNALKFTPRGQVTVRVKHAGRHVRLAVSDTGRGISEENLPRLFQKYEQGFSGNGKAQQGTGLGLYICKTLAELHGGYIEVKSREDAGTTFVVTLPSY